MANSSVKNLNIDGNVIISGSTTSIDVQQLTTDDNNITLNDIASPTDSNANAGGLTLKGTTDHTWNWLDATDSWTSSEHIDLATGKEYKINNTSVLSATTLGAGVVNSNLTDVGTLTSLQVDLLYLDGSQIGLKTTDEDLITLTANTVTVAGTVAATALTGDGTGITGISTSNITVPASAGDFLYNNAGAWGGITPPISVALGGTGATTAAAARTALGITATGVDTTYAYRANNLSDLASASTARTNLGLGTMAVETATDYLTVANDLSDVTSTSLSRTNLGLGTADSPNFGGVGAGAVTITATPSSGGTVAPTFAGVSFKSVPIASGSGHKWVIGNEQDGDLAFSYFTINDAGANTSSAVGYITADPTNTRVILGNTGGTPVNVVISGLGYPTADGTANQVLTTDGAASLTFATPLTTNITEGTNLYYTAARDTAQFNTDLATKTTANLAEGSNLYYTTARWDIKMAAADTSALAEGSNLYYTNARARAAISESSTQLAYNNSTGVLTYTQGDTGTVAEGSNLYYTNARADARIAAASINALSDVTITTPATNSMLQYNGSAWIDAVPTTAHVTEGANLYYTDVRADARIVNAGSANWNTAYTDTNAATESDSNNTLVKRGNTGNVELSKVTANNGVIFGNNTGSTAGTIRWTGTDFQGYNGAQWESLTSSATAQISGSIATFTTSPTVTSTSYADIAGYTTAITVTTSNIINVQVNVDLTGPASSNNSNIKLVRVVGGTPTDLYIDESGSSAAGTSDHLNIVYADAHGQSNGTVITYKLMAKVDGGTLTVNPNGTNAQIFLQELTTSATSVVSVNGAAGVVVLDSDDIAEGSTNLYHQSDLGSVT